jgi:serine protease Do
MKLRQFMAALVAVLFVVAAASEVLRADEPRANATVKAVRKVKPSVVAIKVPGATSSSKGTVGTGVIIDERGYIVTNRHVVSQAERIIVRLVDESEFTATVVVTDPNNDLAILKIDAGKKLPALPLGPANDLEVGEDVIAIGHPYGYSYTVSKGIVSALGRRIELPNGTTMYGLIQHNASINPGNSGGPLVNINGEFIGINTAMRDGAQGIAFAVNTDTLKKLLSEKLSAYKVAGVSHGLFVQDKVVAETGDRQQVIVTGLTDTGAVAGLKNGDVISCVGTMKVKNSFDLERALWDAHPGQKVEVHVVRGGQEVTVTLTLGDSQGAAVVSARSQ